MEIWRFGIENLKLVKYLQNALQTHEVASQTLGIASLLRNIRVWHIYWEKLLTRSLTSVQSSLIKALQQGLAVVRVS